MTTIIIVTHGKMAEGIVDAVETIFGTKDGLSAIGLFSNTSAEELGREITEQVMSASEADSVVIFTDLVSATPYNQSVLAINQLPKDKQASAYIIAGVSLPMVLEAVNQRLLGTHVSEAVEAILKTGQTSVGKWSIHDLENDEEDDF